MVRYVKPKKKKGHNFETRLNLLSVDLRDKRLRFDDAIRSAITFRHKKNRRRNLAAAKAAT